MRDDVHVDSLFAPLALGPSTLPNRMAVAPAVFGPAILSPLADLANADRWRALAAASCAR